ncbi:MAG: glycosyltransferase family 2 protein [Cyanobium sp. M30B3]|nr:MAG: glycosyltransferase family 2 protein [Cyanobium sp. M30B3]
MSPLPSINLITPCRNRAKYLRSSLPSWLACPQLQRIIVVDFNSTTPVINELNDLIDERVTVVRVEDEPLWRQGRAQNVGLRLTDAELVLKMDADVALVDIRPYVDQMADHPTIFFKGFSKLGTSSGLCLAPRRWMRAAGGYHDHMSGWGADDLDVYRRLKKQKLKPLIFKPESFSEQRQTMAGKNSEAPLLDSELLSDPKRLASQPFFSNFRNILLATIQRQTKHRALRWRYNQAEDNPNLVYATMKPSSLWRIQLARHHIELANILALAYYERTESAWTLMNATTFQEALHHHQLPRCRSRREREALIATLPQRRLKLREFAQALGVDLQTNPMPA